MAQRTARIQAFTARCVWFCSVATACFLLLATAEASELRNSPIVRAVQQAKPSTVNIRGEKTLVSPASASSSAGAPETNRRVNGMGTGVVIDPRGYIVTNYHVVDGVKEIQVTLPSEEKYIARLIARDLETDLAVIKIDAPNKLPTITIGTSSDLMPGESVIAVGNAYGYENTVTRGIVSALHRAVQVSDAQFYDDLIQTDAPINPGNSGGPLLNVDGEMVGINVAVRAGAQNIGFAIPVDKVIAVTADLIASYNAKRGFHGLTLAKSKGSEEGVLVAAVAPESPAAEAGLEPGDVVKSIDNIEIHRPLDFQRALLEVKPGQQLEIVAKHKEEKVSVNLALAEVVKDNKPLGQPAWDVLGLELKPIPPEEFRQNYQTRFRGGLLVAAVRPDSPASRQSIRPGDVLVGMHIWETISIENVSYILNRPDLNTVAPVKFFILRGNETLYGYFPAATPVAMKKTTRQE
jgi:serine protease Do